MATAEVVLGQDGPFPTPHDYTLSSVEAFEPTAVFAIFDGTAAGASFLACLTFLSQDGRVLARTFPTAVPAGDVAGVTFSPFALAVSSAGGAGGSGAPSIFLPPLGCMLPDGSAGNLAPQRLRVQGTEANPKKTFPVLAYDGSGNKELATWTFRMPDSYTAGGKVTILWYLNAVTNAVEWSAMIGAVTAGDADTPIEHAPAAASATVTNVNTVEANRLAVTVVTLANLDSVAPGDLVFLTVFRDSGHAGDTAPQDALYVMGAFTV